MATGIDQIIGPITAPVTGIAGLDPELDDQHGVERLPQVEHDGMAHLSSSLRDYHKLNMMVWLISARPSETEGSNLRWPDIFRMHGNPLLKSSTPPSGDNGRLGVAERALMLLPLLQGIYFIICGTYTMNVNRHGEPWGSTFRPWRPFHNPTLQRR